MSKEKKNKFFDFSNLKGDVLGGITAGIVALPLALAFGLQSGMGAAAGLYGAVFIGFFAALFGGTSTQISGPTAPMTAVSMLIIAGILGANDGDMDKALPAILTVFLLAGFFQIILGILKVGKYIKFIPYPVVSGFMTGIGVIILITQLLPLLGYYPKEDADYVDKFVPKAEEVLLDRILVEEAEGGMLVLEDFRETIIAAEKITPEEINKEATNLAGQNSKGVIGTLKTLPNALANINFIDLILALLTIAIIYGFKRVTTAVPSTLVALLAVSLGAYFLLPEYRTIGDIPRGFPSFQMGIFTNFSFGQIQPYIFTALSLALLGTIDSLLTSIVADNMTKTKHEPNKELVGQGIGNSLAALFGGIPGAGATIRTVVNINSGGKTKISGMIAGVIILIVLLLLGPLASKIPAAVLAGILITVGIGVMDYKGLGHVKKLPIGEVAVMIIVLILTVFVGLIEAVGVGMVLASLLFMKKISNIVDEETTVDPLNKYSSELPWLDETNVINAYGEKVYIKHLSGPLFFGSSSDFQNLIDAEVAEKAEIVIIRMERVPYIDQSGAYAMEEVITNLESKNVQVVFTDVHEEVMKVFRNLDIVPGLVKDEDCFETFVDCSKWLAKEL